MIITFLKGGLGNQMFQYAVGRSLALQLKVDLQMDLSCYAPANQNNRSYELGIFENLEQNYIKKNTLRCFYLSQKLRNYNFPKLIWKSISPINLFQEKSFAYNNEIKFQTDYTILNGYWQSEKYFSKFAETILYDFQFPPFQNVQNINISNQINNSNSVSLHIRRTDYLLSQFLPYHGLCSMSYYEAAMNLLESKFENLEYFIFSDDPAWCKLHFTHKNMRIIDWNKSKNSYKDMQLMSLCKHNIIANSSFSWWGAWLNQNKDKTVIAPKKWFADEEMQSQTKDLLPKTWLQV